MEIDQDSAKNDVVSSIGLAAEYNEQIQEK